MKKSGGVFYPVDLLDHDIPTVRCCKCSKVYIVSENYVEIDDNFLCSRCGMQIREANQEKTRDDKIMALVRELGKVEAKLIRWRQKRLELQKQLKALIHEDKNNRQSS